MTDNSSHCLFCHAPAPDHNGTICAKCADKLFGDGHDHKQKIGG